MNFKNVKIKEDVFKKISDYCKSNNLKISDFCSEKLEKAILIEQYGETPFGIMIDYNQHIEKNKIEPANDAETGKNEIKTESEITTKNIEENGIIIRKRRL